MEDEMTFYEFCDTLYLARRWRDESLDSPSAFN
jgi:hypothetical protein